MVKANPCRLRHPPVDRAILNARRKPSSNARLFCCINHTQKTQYFQRLSGRGALLRKHLFSLNSLNTPKPLKSLRLLTPAKTRGQLPCASSKLASGKPIFVLPLVQMHCMQRVSAPVHFWQVLIRFSRCHATKRSFKGRSPAPVGNRQVQN